MNQVKRFYAASIDELADSSNEEVYLSKALKSERAAALEAKNNVWSGFARALGYQDPGKPKEHWLKVSNYLHYKVQESDNDGPQKTGQLQKFATSDTLPKCFKVQVSCRNQTLFVVFCHVFLW